MKYETKYELWIEDNGKKEIIRTFCHKNAANRELRKMKELSEGIESYRVWLERKG